MISPEEEKYILSRAYVPEHIVNLIVPISKGEPSLIDGYICFSKDNWIIFVGYPLDHDFTTENLERVLSDSIKKFQPEYVWLIAPEIPPSLTQFCQERESDWYYTLGLQGIEVKKGLRRAVRMASRELTVERNKKISKEHKRLVSEFIERKKPSPRVRELFLSMPEYVTRSETSIVLDALNKKGELTAFYVVELGANDFATYVVGCYSKKNYVPYASDLLFFEMMNLAKDCGKSYIHLGLGVNEGIRKFKEKWGGVPFLRYEFCEYRTSSGRTEMLKLLRELESKL